MLTDRLQNGDIFKIFVILLSSRRAVRGVGREFNDYGVSLRINVDVLVVDADRTVVT